METKKQTITEEQGSKLKELNTLLSKIFEEVGRIEIQKSYLLNNYQKNNEDFIALKQSIKEEYGDITINLDTLEYTVDEKQQETNEPN
jgi:hypothetical protein